MSVLARFLQRNQITRARPLPLVHTTDAYFLKKIIESNQINAEPCNVFREDKLAYFFVGRAAYKRDLSQEAQYWELPTCIVFEYFLDGTKRIFPFDTGAFHNRRYPHFINMMDIGAFDVSSDSDAPQKIIGTFFGNSRNYYRLTARPKEQFENMFEVEVLDEEMKALHALIQHKSNRFDDRRFAIEVQFDRAVSLTERRPLLAILPETYLNNPAYIKKIERTGASILTYPVYPLRKEYFYAIIYEKLEHFYIERGYYV